MKSKKYKSLLIASTIALTVGVTSSCNDYLDLKPKSSYDESYVFSTVTGVKSALYSVYEQLTGDYGYGSRMSMIYPYDSDDFTGVTGAADNAQRGVSRYIVNPSNTQINRTFFQFYSGIERANNCIKNIPLMTMYNNGTEAEKAELRSLHGEALTLRAIYFFDLVKLWGDVPAPFVPSLDQTDLKLSKTDRDVIYDKIVQDLEVAAELVPWTNSAPRLTKAAVKGMRARIALFAGGYSLRKNLQMERRADYLKFYEIAKKECAEVIAHGNLLSSSFENIFKTISSRSTHSEVLFEVSMAQTTDSKLGYYDGPKFIAGGISLGNGANKILPTYFYAFDSLDLRRDVTAAPYTINFDNNTKAGATFTNTTVGKFRIDWISGSKDAVQQLGINFPMLRYSDVLLMHAEADNELNGVTTDEGWNSLKAVHDRAFVGGDPTFTKPASKDDFFKAVVKERWLEFGGEGLRKYDLIRWNMLQSQLEWTKAEVAKMIAVVPPYHNLPQAMYYKTGQNTIQWLNSFYQPSPTTTDPAYAKVSWVSVLATGSNITFYASGAFQGKKNISLYPFPEQALQTNEKLTQDYGF